jgi:hypothetical protein
VISQSKGALPLSPDFGRIVTRRLTDPSQGCFAVHRQRHDEAGAAVRRRFVADAAAVTFGDLAHQRQSQTPAARGLATS